MKKLIAAAIVAMFTCFLPHMAAAKGTSVPVIIILMNAHNSPDNTGAKLTDLVDIRSIPLGCFTALDESDNAYKDCRRPSMRANLSNASRVFWEERNRPYCYMEENTNGKMVTYKQYPQGDCDVEKHLNWELEALKALIAAATKTAE